MPCKLLFFCWSILAVATSFSQDLLTNGGFEEENICTEYRVNCSPEAWITNKDGFSTYINDSTGAWQGKRYIAIEVGHTSKTFQRTFYRSRLLCGLKKDHQYRLEFYIRSPLTILDSIGVLFSAYDFLFSKQKLHTIAPAMFITPAAGVFRNDSNWQKISMIYTASGDESFFTIASFARRDLKGGSGVSSGGHFFVFIDEISLMPLDLREQWCREAMDNKQNNYDQDERHEMLRNKIRQNNDDPPIVALPPMLLRIVDTLVLPDVLFAVGKADLRSDSYGVLDEFCRRVATMKIDSIVVEGHTDNTGSLAANEKLSLDRANSARAALQQRLSRFRPLLVARGRADKKAAASNANAAGRQRNRRVEILVYATE